jgi:hypothetical protein
MTCHERTYLRPAPSEIGTALLTRTWGCVETPASAVVVDYGSSGSIIGRSLLSPHGGFQIRVAALPLLNVKSRDDGAW